MEPHHARHGHTRSMSYLAEQEKRDPDLPFAASIPLPPSPLDPEDSRKELTQEEIQQAPLIEPGILEEEHTPSQGVHMIQGRTLETPGPEVPGFDSIEEPTQDPSQVEQPSIVVKNEPDDSHGQSDGDHLNSQWPQEDHQRDSADVMPGLTIETPGVSTEADGQETPTQPMPQAFPMNIDALLDVFRRSRDEAQRCLGLKKKVHNKLRQTGSRRRTIPALQHRSRQLAECLQKDRATTFSHLYSEAEDKASQAEPVDPSERAGHEAELPFLTTTSSWTSHISRGMEESMLSLINSVRTDDTFLANRIAQLPLSHLNYLSRLHRSSAGSEPDLIHHGKGNVFTQPSRPPSRFSLKPDSYESMSDLRRDPLQLLIHGVWDCQLGSHSAEHLRRQEVWSSVCSKLITQATSGSNNFCVAVLNELALEDTWKLRSQFEMLLLGWMQSGAFLLDPQAASQYEGETDEARRTRIAADEPRFCDSAVLQLLRLLVENEDTFVPRSCLDLIRSTVAKIDDAVKRRKASGFFIMIWFCQTFLSDALLSPESRGLLHKHYVGTAIKQKLLRGVLVRLQMTVAAALAPTSQALVLTEEAKSLTRRLIKNFEPSAKLVDPSRHESVCPSSGPSFLMLRRSDILALCVALFPNTTPAPEPQATSFLGRAFGMPSSGSAATSVGTVTPLGGTASSFAPSTSSTSITSDTFFSAPILSGEGVTFTVSGASSRPLTPGNQLKVADENYYLMLARELQGIAASPQMQMTRKGPDAAGALFYLVDGRASLVPPRPSAAACSEECLQAVSSSSSQTVGHASSLYDMLESCLAAIAAEPRESGGLSKATSIDVVIAALQILFKQKVAEAHGRLDFGASHLWHRALCILVDADSSQTHSVLTQLSTSMQSRIQAYDALSEMYQDWLFSLGRRSQVLTTQLAILGTSRKALRDKMWFASDVRHSKIYEEAVLVARALATMGQKGGSNSKEKGLGAWARKKWKSLGPERAEAKTLSELSAGKSRGGKAKLNDSQAERTERWLVNEKVENFCLGEERIQRFCMELRRAVDRLVGETAVASPSLWSSVLFARERAEFGGLRSRNIALGLGVGTPTPRTWSSHGSTAPGSVPSAGSSRIFPFSLSPPHSRQLSGARDNGSGSATIASITSTTSQQPSILDSPIRFNHTVHSQGAPENSLGLYASWPLPPSPVSPSTTVTTTKEPLSPDQQKFLDELRSSVTALLLSDLGLVTWANGSETDRWVCREKLGFEDVSLKIATQSAPDLTRLLWPETDQSATKEDPDIKMEEPYREPKREGSESPSEMLSQFSAEESSFEGNAEQSRFPYEDAYSTLLSRFCLSMDPHVKLDALYELVSLVSVAPPINQNPVYGANHDKRNRVVQWPFTGGMPGPGTPWTGLTRLQEVTANCEYRKMQSLTMSSSNTGHRSTQNPYATVIKRPGELGSNSAWLGDPQIMTFVQALLMDRRFYPDTLFRDLQFIAAFVPTATLDATPQGAAFWAVSLAAMQLKSSLTADMVDRAGQILAHHYDESDAREPVRNESRGNSPTIGNEDSGTNSYGIQGDRVYKGKMTAAELSLTSLNDAARLYAQAALEGDPTAARELGLFYLTKPEIVRRVTLPFSKPGEIFRTVPYPGAANNQDGRNSQGSNTAGDAMDTDPETVDHGVNGSSSAGGGLDPAIFALALHWMEFAADAGDPDAKTFLTENGDFKRD